MSYTYDISITKEFSAAHQIRGISGPCSRLHGHNWKVEVIFSCHSLDKVGFSADFYELEALINKCIITPFDHQYLNDLPPFTKTNPTCEHIALWCYEELKKEIQDNTRLSIMSLSLWEREHLKITIKEGNND